MNVSIINYGVSNIGSVKKALADLSVNYDVVDSPINLKLVDKIILPGVGNFKECMQKLDNDGWIEALKECVIANNKHLLGICLGMQLLAEDSSEGYYSPQHSDVKTKGLGLVPGSIKHISEIGCNLRTPHVGWNEITIQNPDDRIFKGINSKTDFYFVHNYAYSNINSEYVIATVDYNIPLVAAVRKDNVWGVQFHPEKSSLAGLTLIQNFLEL